MEEKKARWIFTPEQKFEILTDIERCGKIRRERADDGRLRLTSGRFVYGYAGFHFYFRTDL